MLGVKNNLGYFIKGEVTRYADGLDMEYDGQGWPDQLGQNCHLLE